ncbi:MAG: two-component regulator propeller domain-containing protein [Bacteroidales bacterium]|jgi:ligand-binding sensor domain-containing protein|nr:histidine kinase [Bacteroidales bacterium]MDD3701069.1 two-component regulator propeller domain-containing protein [Bacteroidales bacterium]MDY0369293.1 two-component regulator propeller domain-containing protein [Bacteroidales bacterium]
MSKKHFITVSILCSCLILSAARQELFFNRFLSENISIEKGLSQNTVYTICQDDEGFMWFGTWEGLNRFDGYSFVPYTREQGLSNESIRTLYQYDNILWVGTENGLNAINLDDGSITSYFTKEGNPNSLTSNWINHITADNTGKLWISTSNGLSALDPTTNSFLQVFSHDYGNPIRSNYINMLVQDTNNNYWIATSNGLVLYEKDTRRTTRFLHIPSDSTSLPDNHVQSLLFDQQGRLWVGTRNGIAYFLPDSMSFYVPAVIKEPKASGKLRSIQVIHEHQQKIWIGTYNQGLFIYDPATESLEAFMNLPDQSHSISDNRVYDIFTDKEGTVWIGTFNGLNKLSRLAPNFRPYRTKSDQQYGMSDNSIWCFEQDGEDKLWIGTGKGINIWDMSNNSFSYLKHDPNNPNSLSGNEIRDIHRDKDGIFWIATRSDGLNRYDPKTKSFKNYRHKANDETSLPDDFILSTFSDSKNRLWVATNNGLGYLQKNTDRFVVFRHQLQNESSLPSNRVYCVSEDDSQRIWICTLNGLSLYLPEEQEFKTYRIPEELRNEKGTLSNQFFSMTQSHDGFFWIGSYNGGLVRFDPDQESFKVWTTTDGLPNNVVYKALEDANGHIWLSTNWGLSRYAPERDRFTSYNVSDGLQSNEFNLNAGMRMQSGKMLFGGMNGFNMFSPDEIFINTQVPEIRITAFKIFNKSMDRRFHIGDTLRLRHNENIFSFEFAALDYTNPSRINYKYKLENFNRDWVERKASQRYAEYVRVNPGFYVFRVIASNSDGFWNEEGIRINILIQPPWYQTWWFRIPALIVMIAGIFIIIFVRTQSVRKKHEMQMKYLGLEKQLFLLEQKALQLQMNPHFLFNSLNSIQSFIVKNDIDNAIHYLSKFSKLMRQTLSNSRESFVSLHNELLAIELYLELEKLRFSDNFSYAIRLDPAIDSSFLEIPPMILQPYVENAVIHGLMHKKGNGQLLIDISQTGEDLLVMVEDNGIGRARASEIKKASGIERESKGMLITSERLEVLNQYTNETYAVQVIDLMDDYGHAKGTRVEIQIHGNMM